MNVYTAADLDDLARLREEVERLRAERDELRQESRFIRTDGRGNGQVVTYQEAAREAAGMVQCDTLDRGQGPCGRCPQCLFKAAHPELTE